MKNPGVSGTREAEGKRILEALAPLTFSPLHVCMEALEPARLPPFKGSTLRGAFGVALRQVSCVTGAPSCSGCRETRSCVYSYIFETPVPAEAQRMRKYTAAPHPFVLNPPFGEQTEFMPGDRLEFGLVLVGRALKLWPHIALAVRRMGLLGLGSGRGRFKLLEVRSLHPSGIAAEFLIHPGQLPADKPPAVFSVHDLVERGAPGSSSGTSAGHVPNASLRRWRVRFLTPCRLMRGGSLTDRPDFHVLFRSLLRATSSLAYFHCGHEPDLDHRTLALASEQARLIADNTHWWDWERYSSRQRTRMALGGIAGEAVYEADAELFLSIFEPFLGLAQVLHVGKGTSMGLGMVSVHIDHEMEAV